MRALLSSLLVDSAPFKFFWKFGLLRYERSIIALRLGSVRFNDVKRPKRNVASELLNFLLKIYQRLLIFVCTIASFMAAPHAFKVSESLD